MPGECVALQGCSRRLPYLTGARNHFSPSEQHLPLCFNFCLNILQTQFVFVLTNTFLLTTHYRL